MKNFTSIKKTIGICFGLLCMISAIHAQNANEGKQAAINVKKARTVIENLGKQYSKYLLEGDSVSIAAMYATKGMMGCKKGPEILSAVGGWIRSLRKNNTHFTFNTVTLNTAGDLLIETGKATARNDKGQLQYTFRYLLVWKKEAGTWKIYRDFGL